MVSFEQFKNFTAILKTCLQEVDSITDLNQQMLQFAGLYALHNFFDTTEQYLALRGKEKEFEDGILSDLCLDNPILFMQELIEKINKSNLHQIAEHDTQIHGYGNFFALIYFFTQFAVIETTLQGKNSNDYQFVFEVILACTVSFGIFYIGAQNSIIPQNFLDATNVSHSLSISKSLTTNHFQALEFNEQYKSMGVKISLEYMSARVNITQIRLFLTRYLNDEHADVIAEAYYQKNPSLSLHP